MRNPIGNMGVCHTPESLESLEKYVAQFNGGEGTVAFTVMGMTWNYCHKLFDQAIEKDNEPSGLDPDDRITEIVDQVTDMLLLAEKIDPEAPETILRVAKGRFDADPHDPRASIVDQITDLMLLAKQYDLEPAQILETATMHYDAECQENPDAEGLSNTGTAFSDNPDVSAEELRVYLETRDLEGKANER